MVNGIDIEKAENERWILENAHKSLEQDFIDMDNGKNISKISLKQDIKDCKEALDSLEKKLDLL